VLDQRVRPMGAHHQNFAVVSGHGALDELAFIGGSDTARSRRKANATPANRQAPAPFSAESPRR
jgi:hypothetical protein